MIRKLILAILALIGLLIAAVVVAFLSIDSIAKGGIERGATFALGVPTTLNSARVGILGGTFSMSGLSVANPSGFSSPSFLTLGNAGVAVSFSSLNQPVVQLPTLSFDNLAVALEKKGGKANYRVILDNLAKLKSGGSSPSGGSEKKFVINKLSLKNIKVSVDLIGGPGAIGDLTKVNIPIDEIKLENVGKTGTGVGGTGVTMEQLSSIIVQAVLAAAADKGGGILPAEVLGELRNGVAGLGQLDQLGMKVLADPAALEKLGGSGAAKAIDQGKKALDEAAKKATGLIPGLKKPDERK